jgi:hypothetical protein
MATLASQISAGVAALSSLVATVLHTWMPAERALGVLAAAFVGGYVLGRPLAAIVRLALIVAGVLVAARLAGVGL